MSKASMPTANRRKSAVKFLANEKKSAIAHPPVGAGIARLRSGRTTQNQGVDQAQYKRESLSAFAQSHRGDQGRHGRTSAPLSQSHCAIALRKTRAIAWMQAGKHSRRQRLG